PVLVLGGSLPKPRLLGLLLLAHLQLHTCLRHRLRVNRRPSTRQKVPRPSPQCGPDGQVRSSRPRCKRLSPWPIPTHRAPPCVSAESTGGARMAGCESSLCGAMRSAHPTQRLEAVNCAWVLEWTQSHGQPALLRSVRRGRQRSRPRGTDAVCCTSVSVRCGFPCTAPPRRFKGLLSPLP